MLNVEVWKELKIGKRWEDREREKTALNSSLIEFFDEDDDGDRGGRLQAPSSLAQRMHASLPSNSTLTKS